MLKVLGGQCRSIPVVDGKVNLVLKAVVPAPADKEEAEKLCSLNGWAPHTDMFNNLMVIPNAIALFALTSVVVRVARREDPDSTPLRR